MESFSVKSSFKSKFHFNTSSRSYVDSESGLFGGNRRQPKIERDYFWPNIYIYVIYLAAVSMNCSVLPLSISLSFQRSNVVLYTIIFVFSIFLVLPLMYLEMFMGLYSKKPNCEMHQMAPIFFGCGIAIFVLKAVHIVCQTIEDSSLVIGLIRWIDKKPLTRCPVQFASCYDFLAKGPLINETCNYYYYSMNCSSSGQLRYPAEANYWNVFKNPAYKPFPSWQLLCVMFTAAVVVKLIILSLFYIFAIQHGKSREFKLQTEEPININDIFEASSFLMYRVGLIVPVGYMTNSSIVKHTKYITLEGLSVITLSLLLTLYCVFISRTIFQSLAGAFGILEAYAIEVPFRGFDMAVIPEFLKLTSLPRAFVYLYYLSLIAMQVLLTVIQMKLIFLNLYSYFPKLYKLENYVRLGCCGTFMLFSWCTAIQKVHCELISAYYTIFLTTTLPLCLAVQCTMTSYVYGVRRICDDIHFETGHRPLTFWKLTWTFLPIFYWIAFFWMATRNELTYLERKFATSYYSTNLMGMLVQIAILFFLIVGSLAYIFRTLGSEHMLVNLIRPQFFWGPPEREKRIKRKQFCPTKAIRSQPLRKRTKTERNLDKERAELMEKTIAGRVFSDSKFFANIGISLDMEHLLHEKQTTDLDWAIPHII